MKRRNGKLREATTEIHKGRNMGKTIIALITIFMASTANAFTFDVWESGMDADTVIMTAMKEDFPLTASGKYIIGKEFNKNACVPYRKTATTYQYYTKLLGELAQVKLFMTEKEKRLMKISIGWTSPRNSKQLRRLLNKIIGNKKPLSKGYKIGLVERSSVYKLDNKNKVEVKRGLIGSTSLIYYDMELIASNTKVKKQKKEEKLIKDVSKDWKKF